MCDRMVQFSLGNRFPDRLYPLDILMAEIEILLYLYTLVGIFTQQNEQDFFIYTWQHKKKQEQVYKNKN